MAAFDKQSSVTDSSRINFLMDHQLFSKTLFDLEVAILSSGLFIHGKHTDWILSIVKTFFKKLLIITFAKISQVHKESYATCKPS